MKQCSFTQFYYKPGSFLEIGIFGHGNWIVANVEIGLDEILRGG
jgi:hypothetical protein